MTATTATVTKPENIIVDAPDTPEQPQGSNGSGKHILVVPNRPPVVLEPWTPDRIIAGQAMGMIYPHEVDFDRFKQTYRYPGDLRDMIIALWLMTRPDNEIDLLALRRDDAYKAAKAWAHELGIDNMKSDAFYEGMLIYIKIVHMEVDVAGGNEFAGDGSLGKD